MSFHRDEKYDKEIEKVFGEYLVTYISPNDQVRAYLFRKGNRIEAHVTFPTRLAPYDVTDPYVTDLRDYAREHGFADRFQMILEDND